MARSTGKAGLLQHQQEHLDTSRPTGEEVTSISVVSKGFFCLVGGKRLCLFSKIADSWDFAKAREYVVPSGESATARSSQISGGKEQVTPNQLMWKIAVSPKEEHVLVLTNKQQIYSVSDVTKDHSAESKVESIHLFIC
jgi:hypothetical protein